MLAAKEVENTGEQSQVEAQSSSTGIAEAMTSILRSPRFRDSPQLQNLLQYVVSMARKGDDDALKERMIGMSVFGRRPDYDTTSDPIVRSRMGLLRRRLAQYYESDEGEYTAVQIVIPIGAYRPSFLFRSTLNSRTEAAAKEPGVPSFSIEVPDSDTSDPSPAMVRRIGVATIISWGSGTARTLKIGSLVAAALLIFVAAWWLYPSSSHSELDALWAPILKNGQPIYVYTGTVPVFEGESPHDEARSSEDQTSPVLVPEPPSVDAPRVGPDHVFSWGEGMLTGSVYADTRLATFLSGYKRTPIMRSGANLPFMDLKGSPLILIGSFDNYWTRVMNEDLPFYLDRSYGISERNDAHRRWFNPLKAEMTPRMMEDYALVFRVLKSKNGAPVLGIVGLSTCGTHAAADFVTDPLQMRALAAIPRAALRNKNIELVLRTSLVNCAPTSVEVIASKVW